MATDPEYDALYAAVCADPDDDTPRLVLADWLDEHNDGFRAAHIRAQIGLAQARGADPHAAAVFDFMSRGIYPDWSRYATNPAAVSPEVERLAQLAKQEGANRSRAEARWKAVFGKRKAGKLGRCVRGVPYSILVSNAGTFARAAAGAPPEPLPGYELVVHDAPQPGFDDLLDCGRLAGARGLSLFGFESAEPVRKFGARIEARNFRALNLYPDAGDPGILAAVATEPNWSGLERLSVYAEGESRSDRFDLPDEFARAEHLRTLTHLDLGIHGLSGRGVATLARLGLPRLRTLEMRYNVIDAAGASALTTSAFPELRALDIGSNALKNAGARALIGARALPALATIDVSSNGITDPKVMAALVAGPCFPVLAGLSVRDNRVRNLDPKILAAPGRGPTLRFLSLRHCLLSAKAVAALASAPALTGLVGIDLAGNELGDEGAAALARGAKWDNLTYIDLSWTGITGEGVRALVAWPGLAKLAYLDLNDNSIGLDGAKALAGCKALKKCRKIVVPYDTEDLPEKGRKLLEATFGKRIAYI